MNRPRGDRLRLPLRADRDRHAARAEVDRRRVEVLAVQRDDRVIRAGLEIPVRDAARVRRAGERRLHLVVVDRVQVRPRRRRAACRSSPCRRGSRGRACRAPRRGAASDRPSRSAVICGSGRETDRAARARRRDGSLTSTRLTGFSALMSPSSETSTLPGARAPAFCLSRRVLIVDRPARSSPASRLDSSSAMPTCGASTIGADTTRSSLPLRGDCAIA